MSEPLPDAVPGSYVPETTLKQVPGSRFVQTVGLQLEVIRGDRVIGRVELGPDHHQPAGIVHGGVYAAIVEEAASYGAMAAAMGRARSVVGVSNTTHFVRAFSHGRLDVEALPIQRGRTQQLWEVCLTDGTGAIVATGQVRLQNLDAGPVTG